MTSSNPSFGRSQFYQPEPEPEHELEHKNHPTPS